MTLSSPIVGIDADVIQGEIARIDYSAGLP